MIQCKSWVLVWGMCVLAGLSWAEDEGDEAGRLFANHAQIYAELVQIGANTVGTSDGFMVKRTLQILERGLFYPHELGQERRQNRRDEMPFRATPFVTGQGISSILALHPVVAETVLGNVNPQFLRRLRPSSLNPPQTILYDNAEVQAGVRLLRTDPNLRPFEIAIVSTVAGVALGAAGTMFAVSQGVDVAVEPIWVFCAAGGVFCGAVAQAKQDYLDRPRVRRRIEALARKLGARLSPTSRRMLTGSSLCYALLKEMASAPLDTAN